MQLHGPLPDNLRAALASIRRLRGQRVHPDTMEYWEALLAYARDMTRKGRAGSDAADLVRQLGIELAERQMTST